MVLVYNLFKELKQMTEQEKEPDEILVAESVGKGHPDKICDQIADTILDACLTQDKNSRVACEVMASNRLIVVGGEISTTANYNVEDCVWKVLIPLGYHKGDFTIIDNIHQQSPDISKKVNKTDGTFGAGDQGITYGYATNETKNYLPIAYDIANELLRQLDNARTNAHIPFLSADMKSQVELYKVGNFYNVKRIILAVQHDVFPTLTDKEQWRNIIQSLVHKVLGMYSLECGDNQIFINAGGDFIIGGPIGDTGLTGRKLQVDTYGPEARHGGGALSGKDYTKVDRSGAYLARWIAKNVVYNKLAKKCEIGLAWEIGNPCPDELMIDCFGTNTIPIKEIRRLIMKNFFGLNINYVVNMLSLDKPIYAPTSVYGHFSNPKFAWEKVFVFNK